MPKASPRAMARKESPKARANTAKDGHTKAKAKEKVTENLRTTSSRTRHGTTGTTNGMQNPPGELERLAI